ncbi:AfsA-related hotdog domain-containing protein [Legionella spiritensis]|uniref:AfsA-related hotdog domain-containing protein n=1 Tax=Legionella spiritensis TaxID=452 RepID=UPI000F6E83ED|nr:AfsA-related hotdog domain-containing protein [Legionella spiritensis]VEG92516.1 A-factor biosynthesis hotdog domain [Legionella spiritensis]
MKELRIVIIGNRLTEFANNENILTNAQFNYLIQIESKIPDSQNIYKLHLGQGLSDFQIEAIRNQIQDDQLKNRFKFYDGLHNICRATRQLTHKHKIENSMISEPERISELEFKSYLMLDDSCAEMSDHLTGQHIQGMVLIEASRQMVNSVSEKYLISKNSTRKKGFVLNSLSSKFYEYVFPLDIELIFRLEKIRDGLDGNFKAEASVQIIQNNKLMMSFEVGFSVMDKTTLTGIESQMAKLAVKQKINTPVIQIVKQSAA